MIGNIVKFTIMVRSIFFIIEGDESEYKHCREENRAFS